MTRIDKGIDLTGGRTEKASLLIMLGLLFIGFFIGQFGGSFLAVLVAFSKGMELQDAGKLYDYLNLGEVLTAQMIYTLVFTFLTPWFYLKVVAKKSISGLFDKSGVKPLLLLATVILTLSFMIVNAYFIQWNANIVFPDFMSGFEEWARELEKQMAEMTERFTTFNNFMQFLFGFFAIAVLPGIGEELLFRGILQNGFHRFTKNAHVAIWVSAFLFAAIHMQFYGLVPRMMLGAVFGYLYVWSGNLWYPIIAHATNNGVTLILTYVAQIGQVELNPDEAAAFPLSIQLTGVVVFILFMCFFRKYYLNLVVSNQ